MLLASSLALAGLLWLHGGSPARVLYRAAIARLLAAPRREFFNRDGTLRFAPNPPRPAWMRGSE